MELIDIIDRKTSNNLFYDTVSLYIDKYNIKDYVKDIKIKKIPGPIIAQYLPRKREIIINNQMDLLVLFEILKPNLIKYKVNPNQLIKILKTIYIIHELRHAYQNKIYHDEYIYLEQDDINKSKDINKNLYTKIIGDCIEYQTQEIYKENYNYMTIEKDSQLESYKEIIIELLKIDDKAYNKILNYLINKYKKEIIPKGYIKNDLTLSSIKEMYQIYDIEDDYKIIKPYFQTLSLYEKTKYNIDLTNEQINIIKRINKENIKTFLK